MSRVLDVVWMLVSETDGQNGHPCVVYRCSGSAKDVWDAVLEDESMGTGVTKEDLKRRGYRAKKVQIVEVA